MASFDDHSVLAPGEQQRIDSALEALRNDPHAPREITTRVILNVFREFPKHVTVGKNKDGSPVTKIAQNADEEAAILAGLEPAQIEADSSEQAELPVNETNGGTAETTEASTAEKVGEKGTIQ